MLYYYRTGDQMMYVAIYVDDVSVFGNDKYVTNRLKLDLIKYFKMNDLGEALSVLGVKSLETIKMARQRQAVGCLLFAALEKSIGLR